MHVFHFAPGLRIAIDPDHVTPVRTPRSSCGH
jgi:hypothetical protein